MKHLKITLTCAGGMSTGIMCKKIRDAAAQRGFTDVECSAYALEKLPEVAPGSDVILLGPQVSFQLEQIRAAYPDIPVELMDMMDYGMMNGKKIFDGLAAKYHWEV